MDDNFKHSGITQGVIECYYKVYNTLGYGFLEKVYHNALILELKTYGFECVKEPDRCLL